MKAATIFPSETPAACICAMRSFAGLEKWHSSILHVATESLHPHWQPIRAPTRRTSTLGFSDAVCARAAAAKTAVKKLLRNLRMFLDHPHYFCAGVLHFHLAGDQADQRSADQHQ